MSLVILTVIALSMLLPPMGCIMLWYKYNYFNDGFIHACLFSGIISYFFNTSQIFSMMIVAVLFSSLVFIFKFHSNKNATTSVISNAFLALSLILASKLQERVAFETMLFGDIFIIESSGFYLILAILAVTGVFIKLFFRKVVIAALDSDIAKTSDIPVDLIEFIILLILSLIIAVSIKFTGAFLIGAFLIIPAASARLIAKSPVQMISFAILISIISGIAGFYLSLSYDFPLSPSISVMFIVIYIILYAGKNHTNKSNFS